MSASDAPAPQSTSPLTFAEAVLRAGFVAAQQHMAEVAKKAEEALADGR